ncbi:unnamed protein product, partial [Strongylus vulgaris]
AIKAREVFTGVTAPGGSSGGAKGNVVKADTTGTVIVLPSASVIMARADITGVMTLAGSGREISVGVNAEITGAVVGVDPSASVEGSEIRDAITGVIAFAEPSKLIAEVEGVVMLEIVGLVTLIGARFSDVVAGSDVEVVVGCFLAARKFGISIASSKDLQIEVS